MKEQVVTWQGPAGGPCFLCLDLEPFCSAAEVLRRPELRGRAVGVAGGEERARATVVCASREAREAGVFPGLPLRRARARCPELAVVPADPDHYLALSGRILAALQEAAPRALRRGLGAFDVELSGCERLLGDLAAYARGLQARLRQGGLSSAAGLAATPLVARVAAAQAGPDGFRLVPPGEEAASLAGLPLPRLPGVGPRSAERLEALGLRTVGELARLDPEVLAQALGPRGRELHARAGGGSARLVGERSQAGRFAAGWAAGVEAGEDGPLPRSISRERTFPEDLDALDALDAELAGLVERASSALRGRRLRARSLSLAVRYADLREASRQARLPREAEEEAVLACARRLLRRLLERRVRVRRLGLTLLGLEPAWEQLGLFDGPDARDRRALGLALDRVRLRHGWEALRFGAGLTGEERGEEPGARRGPRRPAGR